MMKRSFLLLLLFYVSSPVKHSLTYFLTTSSGLQTFPEFVSVSVVDGVQVGYCDSNSKTAEPRQDWVRRLFRDNPGHLEWHSQNCKISYVVLKEDIDMIKLHFNQTGGVHILQEMSGCDWDDVIDEVTAYDQFGYDGEEFTSLDLRTLTWVFKDKADTLQNKWKRVNNEINHIKYICPECLKKYMDYVNRSLKRKALPSVSLLQKTPSSPVSCHATGFYPDRASMFWRKDGEEIHEDVDHGEILPNHDGTFQLRVDLNISSVKPEDWSRYDCVFQFSGAENIITKLDKAKIRTNKEFPAAVIGVVVGLLLLLVCITGLFIWRKKKKGFRAANTSDSSSPNRQTSDPL
ncbi:major histocompatibility complex class I-related gene protein-like isoform X4 [Anabas testudineus]|uniref:major histocompatibility complex class I-related gene protein-like isoform X4 n=1 Tax=Anabas testudineus TaxID=64144 RepID=UPI00143D0D14|nr:major histocompatibility complex class I-related gene protein-like isoform X4 [Anabas testudineus]